MARDKYTFTLILILLAVALVLIGFILTMLYLYQRRYFRMKAQLEELKAEHAREIEAVQKEIYRQSLDEIATEIHDDFGQRLSLIKLMLSALEYETPTNIGPPIKEIKLVATKAVEDLRNLTHQLRTNYANHISLPEVMEQELTRLERLGILATRFDLDGIPKTLENKTALFLFRMFQESLNNIIAHSKAENCFVRLNYNTDELTLTVEDDGIGFNPSVTGADHRLRIGQGLSNITKRCSLIGATLHITSEPAKGTAININLPYKTQMLPE